MLKKFEKGLRKSKSIYRLIYRIYLLFTPLSVGLGTKIRMIINGFKPSRVLIYDLQNYKIQDYLPDIKPFNIRSKGKRIIDINKDFFLIPQCKIIGNSMLKHYISVPETLAYINDGYLYSLNDHWESYYGNIDKFLESNYSGVLFFKQLREYGGIGAFKLSIKPNSITLNNRPISASDLKLRLNKLKHFIVQKAIDQDKFGTSLFPEALNTMRLLTIVDPYTNETYMPFGAYRVGVNKSAPVDNTTSGGIFVPIDMNTGALGKGSNISGNKINFYTHHPDTGNIIEGLIIPNWLSIKKSVLNTANKFPYLRFLSWDVAISNNLPIVLEFGNGTDIVNFQVHFPFLGNPRLKRFFQYHQVTHHWG